MRVTHRTAPQAILALRHSASSKLVAGVELLLGTAHWQPAAGLPFSSACSAVADAVLPAATQCMQQPQRQASGTFVISAPCGAASEAAVQYTANSGSPAPPTGVSGRGASWYCAQQPRPGQMLASQVQSLLRTHAQLPILRAAWAVAEQPDSGIGSHSLFQEHAGPRPTVDGQPDGGYGQHQASILTARQQSCWTAWSVASTGPGLQHRLQHVMHACGTQQARHYATSGGAWSKGYQVRCIV